MISAIRPGLGVITTTRSASRTASAIEWVMNRIPFGLSVQTRRSCSVISSRVSASSAPNGSSIRRRSGSPINARQMETRCCIPPDNSRGYRRSNPQRPTSSSSSLARWELSLCIRFVILSGNRTLSRMVAQGSNVGCWKTIPTSANGFVTRSPLIDTSPPVGAIRPAMILSKVDLPHPEGPTTATNSLRSIVSETPSSAVIGAPFRGTKTFDRSLTSIISPAQVADPFHATGKLLGIWASFETGFKSKTEAVLCKN